MVLPVRGFLFLIVGACPSISIIVVVGLIIRPYHDLAGSTCTVSLALDMCSWVVLADCFCLLTSSFCVGVLFSSSGPVRSASA